jgi:hypothetical protein
LAVVSDFLASLAALAAEVVSAVVDVSAAEAVDVAAVAEVVAAAIEVKLDKPGFSPCEFSRGLCSYMGDIRDKLRYIR